MTNFQKVATSTALALCLAWPAYAQQQTSDKELKNQPAQSGQMEMEKKKPTMPGEKDAAKDSAADESTMPTSPGTDAATGKPDNQTTTTTTSVQPVTEQEPSQFLAGNLIGSSVYNHQDETVGKVENLAVSKDGNIESVVVSVGGFLGIGSKQVGLPWESMQRMSSEGDMTLRITATADELKEMPEFRTVEAVKREEDAMRAREQTETGSPVVPNTGSAPSQ